MSYLIEIICDRQDERARGARPCRSRDRKSPHAEHHMFDIARKNVESEALATGWKKKLIVRLGRRMGWVCPVCLALEEGDNAGREDT